MISERFRVRSILEEMTKMVLLGVVLWAGVTFGTHVAPYPLNLIVSSGEFCSLSVHLPRQKV